jgi:F-type H+-transporting ATPase subunit a
VITSSIYTNIKTTLLLAVVLFMSTNVLRAQEHHETSPAANTTTTSEHGTEANATEEHTTEEHATEEEGAFNVKEVAMHHIADANQWHIMGDIHIPLPVMILNRTTGEWVVGLSSMFHHEEEVKGFVMHHDRIVPANGTDAYLDLSITKNVFTMLLASFILLVVFISVAKACQNNKGKAPKGLQNIIEPLVIFVKDEIVQPNLGKNTNKFLPYFLTAFFFIWINNILGLIPLMPGGANVMGNIAVTLVLSVFTLLVVNGSAKKDYWKHIFMPPAPVWLWPILIPIELIGVISKPFALMIRLFANMSAGHIIVISLTSLIFVFGKAGMSIAGSATGATIAVPFVLFISIIEILVAFLQAFIFTMLSAVFLGLALEEHHHEEHAH